MNKNNVDEKPVEIRVLSVNPHFLGLRTYNFVDNFLQEICELTELCG